MMIHKKILLIMCLLTLGLAVSCSKDNGDEPEPDPGPVTPIVSPDLVITGLENCKVQKWGIEIPATGISFTTKGKGDLEEYAYATKIVFGDYYLLGFNRIVWSTFNFPPFDKPLSGSGAWGSIKYLDINPPYETEFTISPNKTGLLRYIGIDFGGEYHTCHIYLIQPPVE